MPGLPVQAVGDEEDRLVRQVRLAIIDDCFWQIKKSARGGRKCQHMGWFWKNAIIEKVSSWPLKKSARRCGSVRHYPLFRSCLVGSVDRQRCV
jgi:hypothetical protein